MGRNVVWKTVDALLDAYENGIKTKQGIQNLYFRAIARGHKEREFYYKEVLEIIRRQEEEIM